MKGGRILVVDDKEAILGLWRRILEPDHLVATALDGERAIALLPHGAFDVVVTDLKMPGVDGLQVLAAASKLSPGTEVVVVTAYATVERAVEAMRGGAFDFLTKPFEPDQARLRVERALERRRLRHTASELEQKYLASSGFGQMQGTSAAARRVFGLLAKAAATELTVLLQGESGTGKEVAARSLHAASARKEGPFVAVNCGAIPSELLESELFGHAKGSFSGAASDRVGLFEAASGGTLFLDEVSELPLPMQVKLNRALQEREVRRVGETESRRIDVRVVAASNVDLRERIGEGRFREDLFYRLNVFPIRLPPLRDRREDLPALAAATLERFRRREGKGPRAVAAEAMEALVAYGWPGNVRELENVLQRAAALCEGSEIRLGDLPPELAREAREHPLPSAMTFRDALKQAQDQAARRYLHSLMEAHRGSVTRAAESAGMARETLHRQLKRYGLEPARFRGSGEPES
ncbi:MAG: sigma-54-dependent Fis family transcriptional regulator [Myxococcales bacterium]|nr:sigma-54-dependent Fis family transcriptional regulator [Myxococcales bacterium]